MRCQACGNIDTEVKDSRPDGPLDTIRRRRYCNCGNRFTTYEVYAEDFSRIREDRTDHVLRAAKRMQEDVASAAAKIVKNLEREMRR